jgi:isopentenyldiphosphate isomerase
MGSEDYEILEIVNRDDQVVGTATRSEIHARGLMHRAVHIFVFNRQGEIYIQRRSDTKDRHPSKLDSSAAGHVDPGETYGETAVRELAEELGLRDAVEEILSVSARPETDNEHVKLYRVLTNSVPRLNPAEIQWGGFMSRKELDELIERTPEDFVPAFLLLWKEFVGMGL